MLAITLALAAALLYALGSALQQRVAVDHASTLTLIRRPTWLAGIAADGLGYAAQAAALAVGRLAVVQPLLVSSLVFALPFEGRRVRRKQLVAALAVGRFGAVRDDRRPRRRPWGCHAGRLGRDLRGLRGGVRRLAARSHRGRLRDRCPVRRQRSAHQGGGRAAHAARLARARADPRRRGEPRAVTGLAARRHAGHRGRRADGFRRAHEPADRRARVRGGPPREPVRRRRGARVTRRGADRITRLA